MTPSRTIGSGAATVTRGAGREDDSIAGLRWRHRWGAPEDSETRFVGFSAQAPLGGGFAISGQVEFGRITADGGGAFGVAEPLHTSAGAVSVSRGFVAQEGAGDRPPLFGRLSLTIAQPLRIEDGTLLALTPTTDAYGLARMRFDARPFDAAPSGRQVDARLGIDLHSDRLTAQGQLGGRSQPGHRADAALEVYGSIGLRLAF